MCWSSVASLRHNTDLHAHVMIFGSVHVYTLDCHEYSPPQVSLQYQCATLSGLDSKDGVLLLGTSHFYVIEGLTVNKYAEIVDVETAPEE